MDELQSYLQVFSFRKSELGFWLRRSSGYPLLIVTNVHDEGSAAFAAGIRNNDIVLRIDGRASWAMDIGDALMRSEEHTSELQSLIRISYAVFCLKNKIQPSLTFL